MKICSKISNMTEGDVDRYQMVLSDDGQALGQLGDPAVAKKAEHVLNEQIEARFAEKGGVYIDAVHMVMDDPKNAGLKQAYAGFTQDRYAMERAEPDLDMSSLDAGLEIDSRAHSYMADHQTDYETAYRAVLGVDLDLRVAYGQI